MKPRITSCREIQTIREKNDAAIKFFMIGSVTDPEAFAHGRQLARHLIQYRLNNKRYSKNKRDRNPVKSRAIGKKSYMKHREKRLRYYRVHNAVKRCLQPAYQ